MYQPFPLSADEIAARAKALYLGGIQDAVETPANKGKFLSIDINSGDYRLSDQRMEPANLLRQAHPDALIYTLRIGFPAAVSMSGRIQYRPGE